MPKILVGNKSDLNGERGISYEKGQKLANKIGLNFIETSAKENINIVDCFRNLAN